ncbi:cellulose biosynthesis protein BcsO [Erwinia amylovora]|uniref:cellulose biosynthesis protein BcsO n=1 Tax=Erwinia amylovora TaxID=552 RepID=UPI001443D0B1|nr:cellulose biosynthesis protein BcsO [Erwinia amylovora]
MKSYDDLQRFKEKTQTKKIDFKDMSEHFFNAKSSPWPLIKQLADEGAESVLHNIPLIDAPQAVGPAAFTAYPVSEKPLKPFSSRPFTAAPGASDKVGATLLDSIAASLPLAEATPLAVQPAVKVNEDAPAARPEIATAQITPGGSQLFRSPVASASGALSKDTLLSPLLEKIASCR